MVNFRTEKVSPAITRIFGTSGELWYLVEGSEKAALLDTGSGIGHMKPLIAGLTDKPLMILLTHGHVDHANGAAEFDCPVYMNSADAEIFDAHKAFAVRRECAPPEIRDAIEDSDMIPLPTAPFRELHHGDTFELGGLTIEAYACVGHTPGSMVFLLQQERTVLLGDACNSFSFLFLDYCAPIEVYRQNLLVLKEQLAGNYDRVLLSHGDGNSPVDMIDGVVAVCDDILAGRADDVPFSFMGRSALIAKAVAGPGRRADGGVGNVVYDPANIRAK